MWTAQKIVPGVNLQVILASQYPRTQITASSTSAVGRFVWNLLGNAGGVGGEVREAQKTERVGAIQYELLYTFLDG